MNACSQEEEKTKDKGLEREDIQKGLRALGIAPGDTLMVHSSLSSFGHVNGGAGTVISALLSVLGESGTLIMPTFSRYLQNGEDFWDRENTPSLMGVITENFRRWPGTLRSSHAAHPLAAKGEEAELFCRRPHRTGFGPDSPFGTLLERDGKILLMGVSYNVCTFFHLLEVEANVPYRFLEERKAEIVIDGESRDGSAWEYTRKEGAKNDFEVLGNLLEHQGLVSMQTVGQSMLRLFNARDAYEAGMEKLKENPRYLLASDSDYGGC